MNVCRVMQSGEVLNPHKKDAPLFQALLFGDKVATAKLSKRLSCAVKHLPLRVRFEYEYNTKKAIEAGVTKDPTLVLDGEIFLEGLLQAEQITQAFEEILEKRKEMPQEKMKEIDFESYLRDFDYQERVDMKIQLPELFELYAKGEAQIIDIRFQEEYEAWSIGFGDHIPLNELPDRLGEIDKNKTIVTMCPHYDRAEIARIFLKLKGYNARYLTNGMLGIVDYLRGDKARDYIEKIKNQK